jgi:hypothetical protein
VTPITLLPASLLPPFNQRLKLRSYMDRCKILPQAYTFGEGRRGSVRGAGALPRVVLSYCYGRAAAWPLRGCRRTDRQSGVSLISLVRCNIYKKG